MSETTLFLLITLFIVFIIYAVHIYDRILVKRINEHEEQLEKKGILKRHYYKKDNDNR
tara:strand:- start:11791 stop:11964 length:174 start_codon:yes stop_codon:yes gene_type:complete